MLFAGNIGQFAIAGPFPLGVDGTIVSAGATTVSVCGIGVSVNGVGAGTQADNNKAETTRIILIPISHPYYRWFAEPSGTHATSRRAVRIRFHPVQINTDRRVPCSDA